jgi:hypothetical protein
MTAYQEGFEEYNGVDGAGILRIHGASGGWTVWVLSGDQQIEHVSKLWRFN